MIRAMILLLMSGSVFAANLGTPRIVPGGGTEDVLYKDTLVCNDPTLLIALKERVLNNPDGDVTPILDAVKAAECDVLPTDTRVRVKQVVEGFMIVDSHLYAEIIVMADRSGNQVWADAENLIHSGNFYREVKSRLIITERAPKLHPIRAIDTVKH